MAITVTITAWEMIRPMAAMRARGRAMMAFQPSMNRPLLAVAGCRPPAITSGSGRSPAHRIRAPRVKNSVENRKGPTSSSRPRDSATRPVGPTSTGPPTAPTVEANTTQEMALPRWASSARSAAA